MSASKKNETNEVIYIDEHRIMDLIEMRKPLPYLTNVHY